MRRLLLFCILVLGFIIIGSSHAQVMSDYCSTPPFVSTGLKPNVLVIIDNSNSMDEDFFGNAAGAFNSTDKLVIGKKVIKDTVTLYKDKLRLGLASFRVGSGVSSYYLHNSPYFVSYQLKSYCPNPPQECVDWCKTGNGAARGTCATACQAQNTLFDPDYFDEIITSNTGSTRNKYCELLYPKTQLRETPSNPGIFWYYKQALPMYAGANYGTALGYAPTYHPAEAVYDSYNFYRGKTNDSDGNSGYNPYWTSFTVTPTDSDIAAGYMNFGRRLSWYYIGRTWFKNSSAGDGYIHVNVDDLVNTGGSDTATFTNVIAKLDPKEGNEAGYMSCPNADKDTCSYLIAAGLTPTGGTFQTATNYFQGASSPIQYKCQNNYIVFVTDGLPSVNESGVQKTSDELMPGVLSKINALRSATKSLSGNNYTFDIKTYILGVGLSNDAKAKLDLMAQSGGTADGGGHAYYADNPTAMSDAFRQIFDDILQRASSGTAASVLASSEGSGANILQALFYPKRPFGAQDITWTGEMQNLWYYVDPYLSNANIREDTDTNKTLNLISDNIIEFYFDSADNQVKVKKYVDSDGDGSPNTLVGNSRLEDIKNLWEVGTLMWSRDLGSAPRTIYTTINGSSFLTGNFSSSNASTLSSYLQAADATEAAKIIGYVHGVDQTGYRSRNVTIASATNVWKLGDIINSTPRTQSSIPLNSYHLQPPNGYLDLTYYEYINQAAYKNRGMAYVGGNDGMLHAFKTGKLVQLQGATDKARMDNPDASSPLGSEAWAFVPKNSLPYLKYLTDPNYCHLFYVDAPVFLVDASVNGNATDTKTVTSWKTILIGGSNLGGACRNAGDSCTDCVKTPIADVGYSSYFALDVTDPANPVLLWEFSDPELGFSTSGPAIVRIGESSKNGKWFVVFASGPTGPIDTSYHQFLGKSDQKLKIFVLDLNTGELKRKIDPDISHAFGGSLYNATLDTERGAPQASGHYNDDVLYLGFTKKTGTTWTDGGVLRIVTKESATPGDWEVSTVIDNIGPVTSAIAKLQDRKRGHLWLYFGSGRFFYKMGTVIDDPAGQRTIFGLREPCYTALNDIDNNCSAYLTISDLQPQTTSPSPTLPSTKSGWYIDLDPDATVSGFNAERVITDPLAAFNGAVFFTTFAPNADVCALGGNTYIWALNYSSGSKASSMEGKAILQVSTGEIKEFNLKTAFGDKDNRRTAAISGVPPKGQGLSVLIGPRPLQKVLHIQEK